MASLLSQRPPSALQPDWAVQADETNHPRADHGPWWRSHTALRSEEPNASHNAARTAQFPPDAGQRRLQEQRVAFIISSSKPFLHYGEVGVGVSLPVKGIQTPLLRLFSHSSPWPALLERKKYEPGLANTSLLPAHIHSLRFVENNWHNERVKTLSSFLLHTLLCPPQSHFNTYMTYMNMQCQFR